MCRRSNNVPTVMEFEVKLGNKTEHTFKPQNRKKVLGAFDNIFHVYLMNGLQKYKKKMFFTVAFRGRRGRRGQTTSKLKMTKILL